MLAAWISLIFNHCFHSEHALCKVYLSTKRWAGPSLSGRLDPVLSERLNSRKASFPPRPLKKTGLGLVNRLQSSKTADWAEVNFLILMFETLAKNSPNAARWYCTSRFIKEFENYYHIPAFCCSEQRWWRWFPNSLHELCPKKTCLPFVFCLFGESHVNISNMCLKWYLLKNCTYHLSEMWGHASWANWPVLLCSQRHKTVVLQQGLHCVSTKMSLKAAS